MLYERLDDGVEVLSHCRFIGNKLFVHQDVEDDVVDDLFHGLTTLHPLYVHNYSFLVGNIRIESYFLHSKHSIASNPL